MNELLTLSPAAVAKVAELRDGEGPDTGALRIAVRSGGCSGFRYELYFDGERGEDDTVLLFGSERGSVEVLVDAGSAELLAGARVEYHDGLNGAGFRIENPNAQRRCGCQNSFAP